MPATLVASSFIAGNGMTPGIDTTGADLIVLGFANWVTGTSLPGDTYSNTWTPLTQQGNSNFYVGQMYYCLNPVVGTGHQFSGNGGSQGLVAAAFSNGGAFDQENGAATNSASAFQPGSVTPLVNDELIVTQVSFEPASVVGVDSGFTIIQTAPNVVGVGCSMAYLNQGTATAVNPTWTVSAAANMIATIATFQTSAAPDGNPWLHYAQQRGA